MALDLFLIPVYAFLDRVRGGYRPFNQKLGWKADLLLGVIVAYWIGGPWWTYLAIPPLWLIGMRPGWGACLGSAIDGHFGEHSHKRYARWQVGILKDSVSFSLFVRGLWWGLPIQILHLSSQVDSQALLTVLFSITLAFCSSPLLLQPLQKYLPKENSGEPQIPAGRLLIDSSYGGCEWIRGILFGVIYHLITFL